MDDIRSLLRRAKRADPEAFEQAIRDYLEKGAAALAPKQSGARKRLIRQNYAMLLADVLNRPEGMSETAKLKNLADKGCKYGNGNGQVFKWFNVNTIKAHLKDAKKMADDDPEFAEEVEFYRWAFRVINL